MKKTIQTPAYENLLIEFDSFVIVRSYKQGKGKMYQNTVKEFLIWLEDSGITKIKDVGSEQTLNYFEYLTTRPKQRGEGTLSEKTVKFHLFVLGLFMLNLLEKKEIDNGFYIPTYGSGIQNPRNTLSVDEVKILYESCQNESERGLLSIAYGCGLRRSEIERLNVKDIQLTSGMLIVRSGKGSKRREVPMSDLVVKCLRQYITEERYRKLIGRNQLEEALFLNVLGKRASGQILNELLKKIIEQTNNYELEQKEITLHCLRHSIAHHLSENDAGIEFIRRFLGHSEINTTYIYAIKNKRIKPVVNF